jgi:branched-chain amino acid transport system ATP-binding protein
MSTAAAPDTPLVDVEDVHTYYGKSHILNGVSLKVGRGEVVGLLGRNGVGKSTTLKTIMGLVNPRRGKVLYEGKPVTGLPPDRLARIGIAYVPEDRRIFRLLSVMENLRTGLDRRRSSWARPSLISRCWRSAATRPAALFPAASSRCWRSRGR